MYTKSAVTEKNSEKECHFIRRKTEVKHSMLIRLDRDSKCFETFKVLHENVLWQRMVTTKGSKSTKQYQQNISYLD